MISQRLRGLSEDGEAIDGLLPKLEKQFSTVGISIQDQNGQLRSSFDILQDLAGVWDQLSSKQRQYFGEKVAGNRQVKTLNAIMQNWDVVADTIDKANNAQGAAIEGNEMYMESIEGRITQLKSAFQELATTTINSDFVKGFVDLGISVTKLATDLGGLLPIIGSLTGAIVAIKAVKIADGLKKIGDALKVVASGASIATTSLGAVGVILTAISVGLAVGNGLVNLLKTLDALPKSYSELEEASEKAKQSYTDETNKLNDLNEELQKTQKLIANLDGRNDLSIVEQEELSRLEKVNEQLERQIKLQRIKANNAEKEARNTAVDQFEALVAGKTKDVVGFDNARSEPINKLLKKDSEEAAKILYDFQREFGDTHLDDSTYKNAVVNAYNEARYYRENLDEAQLALDSFVDSYGEYENDIQIKERERLEAIRDFWQESYDNNIAILTSYQDKEQEILGGFELIENPRTDRDRAVNYVMGEEQKLIDDMLLSIEDASFEKIFDHMLSKYSEAAEEIQDIIKSSGEFTVDDLGKPQFESMLSELRNYGYDVDQVFEYINSKFNIKNDPSASMIGLSVSDVGEKLFSSADSKTTKDISAAAASYKLLTAAMAEQQKVGVLSYETWSKLLEDGGLSGIEKYLTLTANGYKLNTEAVYDFVDAQNKEIKVDVVKAILDRKNAIEDYQKALEDTQNPFTELQRAEYETQIADWENQIEQLKAIAFEADNATGALQRYRDAAKSADQDSEHEEGRGIFEAVQKKYKEGKVGSDDFKSGMDFLLGDNWESDFEGNVEKAYKSAEKIGKKYFGKDDKTNANNFANELAKAGVAEYDKKTGQLKMLTNEETGAAYTLDEISAKLAEVNGGVEMSEDALKSLFGLLNVFSLGDQITFDKQIESSEEYRQAVENQTKAQEELATEQGKLDSMELSDPGYQEQVEKVEKLKEDANQATNAVNELAEALAESGNPEVETLTLDQAIEKLNSLQTAIDYLNTNGINVPVEMNQKAETLRKFINELKTNRSLKQNVSIDGDNSGFESAKDETEKWIIELNGESSSSDINGENKLADVALEAEEDLHHLDNASSSSDIKANNYLSKDVENAEEDLEDLDGKRSEAYIDGNKDDFDQTMIEVNNTLPDPKTLLFNATDNGSIDQVDKDATQVENKPRKITFDVVFNNGTEPEPVNPSELTEDQWDQYHERTGDQYSIPMILSNDPIITGENTKEQVELEVVAKEDSGENIVQDVQEEVDNQPGLVFPSFDEMEEMYPAEEFGERARKAIEDSVSNQKLIEIPAEIELELEEPESGLPTDSDIQKVADAAQELIDSANQAGVSGTEEGSAAINELTTATEQLKAAKEQVNSVDINDEEGAKEAASNLVDASANFMTSYNTLKKYIGGIKTVEVTADTQQAIDKIEKLSEIKVNVQVDANVQQNAKGTSNAKKGPSLVDEHGAELIEHRNTGTYELGTNNGARLTILDDGDVVHTASETKKILSRSGESGLAFANGKKPKYEIHTTRASNKKYETLGTSAEGTVNLALAKASKKVSANNKKNTDKNNKDSIDKLKKWYEQLFDWIEIRLNKLQKTTDRLVKKATDAIGLTKKNSILDDALKNVEKQISNTTKAQKKYMDQAKKVAKEAGLTSATIKKIQNGTIKIESLDKNMQEKIKMYQEWYEKAEQCKDALVDLKDTQKELAAQKIDNIIENYENRIAIYQGNKDINSARRDYLNASGKELFASDYLIDIESENNTLSDQIAERNKVEKQLNKQIKKGRIKVGDENWQKYQEKLLSLDSEIYKTQTSIINLQDEANKVDLTKLGYQLDSLTAAAERANNAMELHAAQGITETSEAYKGLIDNGMDQIKVLEEQIAANRELQKGLDVNSEKYQELEKEINSDTSAIEQMKVSQEKWNDSIVDLGIDQIKKYRESLSKANDEYERQKSLQEAIQRYEKAENQRTVRTFIEGKGFVYQADQDELRDAQEDLEGVVKNQLLGKIDNLIDALEYSKKDTNVYDANGNLIGSAYSTPELGTLTSVLANYGSKGSQVDIAALKDSFGSNFMSSISSPNNNNTAINIGDIVVNEANNGNELAQAIVDQFPNALLQAMYKK